MEWAIEKLTELGVARIIPLTAQRSEKHLVQAAAKRCERWRKISRESAQQSRRSDVPEISDPMSVKDCIAENKNALRCLFSEQERSRIAMGISDDNRSKCDRVEGNLCGDRTGRRMDPAGTFELCGIGWQSVSLGIISCEPKRQRSRWRVWSVHGGTDSGTAADYGKFLVEWRDGKDDRHPERSEGSLYHRGSPMHRFFAALRMTNLPL